MSCSVSAAGTQKKEAETLAAYEEANRQHKEVLDAFARGAAGRLAADLKEGEECPVCGSTVHPKPAKAGSDAVSSAQVDEKFKVVGEKHDAWETARKKTLESRETAAKAGEERTLTLSAPMKGLSENNRIVAYVLLDGTVINADSCSLNESSDYEYEPDA